MGIREMFKYLSDAMDALDPVKNYDEWRGLEKIFLFLIANYKKTDEVDTIIIKFEPTKNENN